MVYYRIFCIIHEYLVIFINIQSYTWISCIRIAYTIYFICFFVFTYEIIVYAHHYHAYVILFLFYLCNILFIILYIVMNMHGWSLSGIWRLSRGVTPSANVYHAAYIIISWIYCDGRETPWTKWVFLWRRYTPTRLTWGKR